MRAWIPALSGAASAVLAGLVVIGGSAPAASRDAARFVSHDLRASYPNLRRARGYFLRGVNAYTSPTSTAVGPHTTSLWFQPLAAGAFKQFNTAPYRVCHWDLLRWEPGRRGVLVYLATHSGCFSVHSTIAFHPGIAYMPKAWSPGNDWVARGVSNTVYSEDGTAVCVGTNAWRSRVVGATLTPDGDPAIHARTTERQTLVPVAGAPTSLACPVGQTTTFDWEENLYVSADLGLVRSTGGNPAATRQAGHPQWDVLFSQWEPLPPADAGTVQATPPRVASAAAGTKVTITYTAPDGGSRDASLTVVVPPGWTPPVTSDAPGCTTASVGTVTTSDQTITVSRLALPPNGQTVIDYGATGGGSCSAADGATAPSEQGAPLWEVGATLTPGGATTILQTSPAIVVTP